MTEKLKVFEAINKVQASLSKTGIGKDRTNQQQNYKFRGIDDVYNVLAPLLAENKLCILPRALERTMVERGSKNGGLIVNVTVKCEFHFISSEDGSAFVVCTFGEAMDTADKATNKAMSAAYKYACIQTFSIPTEGDNDADSTTHDVVYPSSKKQAAPSAKKVTAPKEELPLDSAYVEGINCCRTNEELASFCAGVKKELGADVEKFDKSLRANYHRRKKEIDEGL